MILYQLPGLNLSFDGWLCGDLRSSLPRLPLGSLVFSHFKNKHTSLHVTKLKWFIYTKTLHFLVAHTDNIISTFFGSMSTDFLLQRVLQEFCSNASKSQHTFWKTCLLPMRHRAVSGLHLVYLYRIVQSQKIILNTDQSILLWNRQDVSLNVRCLFVSDISGGNASQQRVNCSNQQLVRLN